MKNNKISNEGKISNNKEIKAKSKKSYIVVILLILAILISSIFGYYAYSKYKTTLTGNGTATVAKWSFKVNGQTEQFTIVNLEETMNTANNVTTKRIAPGTSGKLLLQLDARGSEVAVDYTITLDVTNKPTNLKMYEKYENGKYSSQIMAKDNIMTVEGIIPLSDVGTVQNKYIYWEWPYQTGTATNDILASDAIDTAESNLGTINIPITVKATQRSTGDAGTPTIAEKIKVGDTITYSPSGTYTLDKAYATSDTTGTTTLSSSSGQSYNISTWKVLSIDKTTGNIQMVPSSPTTGTVTLQGAQGYNNAVYLLNNACSSLYGNASKGITARSITEEDFAEIGGTTWTNYRNSFVYNSVKYGNQYTSAYTTNKYYPTMYSQEVNSVINGTKSTTGYSQSEQTSLIGRADSSATNGRLQASTSIQPYQTYYNTKDYTTTANLLGGYGSILLPNGSSTQYWVASRCVYLYSSVCYFSVRRVYSGYLNAYGMLSSRSNSSSSAHSLFPVVSLSSELLETTATDGTYNVK